MDICPKCYDDLSMDFNGDKFVCKNCDYEEEIKVNKYEVIVTDVCNAYILDKKENRIVTLCSTKRPDLRFESLKDLVEKANKYEEIIKKS